MWRQGPHHTVFGEVASEQQCTRNGTQGITLRWPKRETDKIQGLNTTVCRMKCGMVALQSKHSLWSTLTFSFLDFLHIYNSLVLFYISVSNTNYLKRELYQNPFGQYLSENETNVSHLTVICFAYCNFLRKRFLPSAFTAGLSYNIKYTAAIFNLKQNSLTFSISISYKIKNIFNNSWINITRLKLVYISI